MINTEEAKGISNILYLSGPKTLERVNFVYREVMSLPDAIRVDSDALMSHINGIYIECLQSRNVK